ncbi:hypothetical protein V6N13_132428 [Hibiscus sabdariffa]|uniref:Uncharacterized protein n=1 Tax=Hibiscus sabdariffa TaxID=183260 RepID=A0ABR2PVB0_9ROSI
MYGGREQQQIIRISRQLRQNQTQDIILRYVNQLCDRMPSPMGKSAVDCKSLSSMPKVFELAPEEYILKVLKVLKFSASAALLLWTFLILVIYENNNLI